MSTQLLQENATATATDDSGRFKVGDRIRCEVPRQPVYRGEVTAVDGREVQFFCPRYGYLLWVPARF